MSARHELFSACRFRNNGAVIDPQPRIRILETLRTAAMVTTILLRDSLQMASAPPATVRTIDLLAATG
jgi:hypothetical protein